jgi:hypothetical protein
VVGEKALIPTKPKPQFLSDLLSIAPPKVLRVGVSDMNQAKRDYMHFMKKFKVVVKRG